MNNLQRDPPRPRRSYNWTIHFPSRDARTIYQCQGTCRTEKEAIPINNTSAIDKLDGITFCVPISWHRSLSQSQDIAARLGYPLLSAASTGTRRRCADKIVCLRRKIKTNSIKGNRNLSRRGTHPMRWNCLDPGLFPLSGTRSRVQSPEAVARWFDSS